MKKLSLNNFGIEKIYVIMMLIFGTAMVFTTPPFQIPDEPNHFYRAYQISEGIFRSPSTETSDINGQRIYYCAEIPASFQILFSAGEKEHDIVEGKNYFSLKSVGEIFSVPSNKNAVVKMEIPNTGSYNPVIYAPQALAIFFARIISDSVGIIFYSARLGALIFVIICGVFALRLLPEKILLIFVISFSPMFLSEAASCSADPVIYAAGILLTAYFLYLRKKNNLSTQDFIFIGLAAILLGLAKQVYGIILLLYLLIPAKKFGGRKNFFTFGILIFTLYLLATAGWMHFSKSGVNVSPYMLPAPNVNLEGQVEFIKNNPIKFLNICWLALQNNFSHWHREFIGVLGWLKIFFPAWFYYFYSAIFLLAACTGKINFTIMQRVLIISGVIPFFLAMFLYMYVTWTPVGELNIWGFQGRYLIPCALMFFSAFSFIDNIYDKYISCVVGFLSAILTVWFIIQYFY